MLQCTTGLFRSPCRRSAVELLQETKSLYQRSESSPNCPIALDTGQSELVTESIANDSIDNTPVKSLNNPCIPPPVPPRYYNYKILS